MDFGPRFVQPIRLQQGWDNFMVNIEPYESAVLSLDLFYEYVCWLLFGPEARISQIQQFGVILIIDTNRIGGENWMTVSFKNWLVPNLER